MNHAKHQNIRHLVCSVLDNSTRRVNPDVPSQVLYFVLCNMGFCKLTGRKIGLEWVARDPANMTRDETIVDIRSGELPDPVQIIEMEFTAAGLSSRDVTEDMLQAAEGYPGPPELDRGAARNDHAHDERKNWRT